MNKQQKLARELVHAFDSEDFQKVQELIALGADINASGRWSGDCTMLWLTVTHAAQEISKDFRDLSAGLAELLPNVSQRDHTAEREKELRIVRMMLKAGADINKPSHGGTPLRIAVHWQDLEVVKLLLANGANPNAETFSILSNLAQKTKPGYWNTVLHEAVMKGSLPPPPGNRNLPLNNMRRVTPFLRRLFLTKAAESLPIFLYIPFFKD
jgi:ankyrin repeat protein